MKLTENQLRRIIRSVITETWDSTEGMGSYEDDSQHELEIQKAYEEGENCSRSGGSPEDCPWDYQDTELEDAWLQGFHEGHPYHDAAGEHQDSDAYRQKEMFRNMRRR